MNMNRFRVESYSYFLDVSGSSSTVTGSRSPNNKQPLGPLVTGREPSGSFSHFGKFPFQPLLSNFQLAPTNSAGAMNLSNYNPMASRKQTTLPHLPAPHPRQLFSNFSPMSNFSSFPPLAAAYASHHQHSNSNSLLGLSSYPTPNYIQGIGAETPILKPISPAGPIFSKNSAFNSLLRGLGSIAYSGRFSCNSQPFNALSSQKVDLPEDK